MLSESEFDLTNSIGSMNLSVLTSSLIGLATESSSNRFSFAVNQISVAHCDHMAIIQTLQSSGNRGFEGRKSKVGSTFFCFLYNVSAKIQLRNLTSKFQI